METRDPVKDTLHDLGFRSTAVKRSARAQYEQI